MWHTNHINILSSILDKIHTFIGMVFGKMDNIEQFPCHT